jgi:hypothetical protein
MESKDVKKSKEIPFEHDYGVVMATKDGPKREK